MWSEADKTLIEQLEGSGDPYCEVRFCCVFRKGNLLLAIPRERSLAVLTLSLYQPQAWKARCLVGLIKILIACNQHARVLPSRLLKFGQESPVAALRANDHGFGFLLGNPESVARRVILARKTDSGMVVDKIGLSPLARHSLRTEIGVMSGLPEGLPGRLEMRQHDENDNWVFYSCSMVEGKSPQKHQDHMILRLLESWLEFAQKAPLNSAVQWSGIIDYIKRHDLHKGNALLAECGDREVMMGIYHGDFAPWNIKITSPGSVVVMDWEHGALGGPAGWDWIHYLLQRARLVERKSDKQAIAVCRDWAGTEEGKRFMVEAGWGESMEGCMGSYLLYAASQGLFDHESLLAEWLKE